MNSVLNLTRRTNLGGLAIPLQRDSIVPTGFVLPDSCHQRVRSFAPDEMQMFSLGVAIFIGPAQLRSES